ncbi:disease resistance protein RUN1-like [Rhodamnia argentea]|uniref:Disease resistance protein RUN1-like n=1 Tax=Rhodamnia argentea TaxID=178133 RepID=A0ABM3H6S4_9MYRT|nr:disease resistance protein RUN1-like [Rhodamnia argentea]
MRESLKSFLNLLFCYFTIEWQRKEAIEAVRLYGYESAAYTSEEFARLPNIRFLDLSWGGLDGDFENLLSELRYMSWHFCRRELLAINFHPSNLVVLDLSWGSITEDWAGWSQIKVAKKLKVLNLSHCSRMTRTPDLSDYLSLERLILNDCTSLVEVDGSFQKLKCLIYFNVGWCTSLRKLPEGIERLEKLEYLYFGHCKKLRKLHESFARVASLVELDLSYTAITILPDFIGNQKSLSVLNLGHTGIDCLPWSIVNLRELQSLVLAYTKIRELPYSIGNLESLLKLDVSGTQCLQLPKSIGDLSRLKVLDISYSWIRELPRSTVELKELEELHAQKCWDLEWEIPEGIWKLSLLRVLNLEFTPIINVPETIKLLPRLEKLGLCGCFELEVMPELPTSLISLSLGSSSLRWVPDLSNLTKLVDLNYGGQDENCRPLFFQDGQCRQSLGVLLPSVSTLSLKYHGSITSLFLHCNLRNLTRLSIYQCWWKEVQLDGLEQLVEFKVEGLEFLEGIAGLSSLKRLKLLRLFNCLNLTTIQGLGSVESLEELSFINCPKITSLDDLSDLKKLEFLNFEECEELQAVKGLDELENLKDLILISCRSLRGFPDVLKWKVPDECSLTIEECPNLGDESFGDRVSAYKQRKVQEQRGTKRKRSARRGGPGPSRQLA